MSDEEFDVANIFAQVEFDKGTDDPWGLSPGTYEVEISDAKIEKSKSNNYGLWLTFSAENGRSIRRWTTMPIKGQDAATYERNTTFLRKLLRDLDIPEERWGALNPDDFIGILAAITVKQQPPPNDEYNQVTKIKRINSFTSNNDGSGVGEFLPSSSNAPVDPSGGYAF